MASGNDPLLNQLGMAHLGSPKALLRKKGGGFVGEFRDFALRGNMLDMAVGIIIGAAFGRVVSSLVSDILMPPIGLLSGHGHSDFSNKFLNLSGQAYATLAEAKAAGAATINYGVFLNALSDFLIVSFAVFLLIRQINRLKTQQPPATTRECPFCISPISPQATRCPHCTSTVAAS